MSPRSVLVAGATGNQGGCWTVGHDIPLVLDALPKKRGMAKDEIVDELLEHATEMIDDIALVMMDREFDSDPVKDICEEHEVYYLDPKRKFAAQNDTIAEMKQHVLAKSRRFTSIAS